VVQRGDGMGRHIGFTSGGGTTLLFLLAYMLVFCAVTLYMGWHLPCFHGSQLLSRFTGAGHVPPHVQSDIERIAPFTVCAVSHDNAFHLGGGFNPMEA
jgi:hypothetical protein